MKAVNHTGRSADLYTETFSAGDRVMTGLGDGHDHGTIVARTANSYEINWDYRDTSTIDGVLLQAEIAESECGECRAIDAAASEMIAQPR